MRILVNLLIMILFSFSAKSDGISELKSQKIPLIDFALYKIDADLNAMFSKNSLFENYLISCSSNYSLEEIRIGCSAELKLGKKIRKFYESKEDYKIRKRMIQDMIGTRILSELGNISGNFYPSILAEKLNPTKYVNPLYEKHVESIKSKENLMKKIKNLIKIFSTVTYYKHQGVPINTSLYETCQTIYDIDLKYKKIGLEFKNGGFKRTCKKG